MIEFRNVSKTYNNGTEALHNINLKVDKGEFVFIVGSSGAGKSTFLKLIMCEERPNSGQIIIDGEDVSKIKKRRIPYLRRKMGNVFQDFRLIDHMTVYDNVAFAMRVVGASTRSIKKRVPYILGLVGLQHKAKHYPNELSGGERQRVGLARALVNNPSMIIADEPTGNIDPALSFEIVDLLNEINRRGTTILMVTHEHSLVKHFHKRIIQIHSGEIVADTAEKQAAERYAGKPVERDLSQTNETVYDEDELERAQQFADYDDYDDGDDFDDDYDEVEKVSEELEYNEYKKDLDENDEYTEQLNFVEESVSEELTEDEQVDQITRELLLDVSLIPEDEEYANDDEDYDYNEEVTDE